MVNFELKDSDEYYLCLSDQPERFDADSPATSVFFDDTNGQVFTVRSGGVTGVTVSSMDKKKSTSFRMEDRGPIISIKFSPDQNILAIQRNQDNQNATVEFVNFKDLAPTNVEYSHTCKWKNAKMLGFVWPKGNEIAFITDHGIELLQVLPEKKQLKSLKNVLFSGAWFSWCAQSSVVLLAGNNGVLLQPFTLNNSTITKLQKLELEGSRPAVERDVFVLAVGGLSWCAVFRHAPPAPHAPPTEVWVMPISGAASQQVTHVLQTGLAGRFAVSVVDDLIVVHHQSSQSSLIFDLWERVPGDTSPVSHAPCAAPRPLRPAALGGVACPMYSGTWVVFQPAYIIDARLGALWEVTLLPAGLAREIPKPDIPRTVSLLLRRSEGRETVYGILSQMVAEASSYIQELSAVFDEINSAYLKWAEGEFSRSPTSVRVALSQSDVCTRVLQPAEDNPHIVQVVTAWLASVSRCGAAVAPCSSEVCVRSLVRRGEAARLFSLARRGAAGESRVLACALLSLGHLHPPAAQLALDMMTRINAHQDVIEVLVNWGMVVSAVGAARAAEGSARGKLPAAARCPDVWGALPPRKLLSAAAANPQHFLTVYHALRQANEKLRGHPQFLKGENCDIYDELYKQLTEE